jgi:signal transduction histidine kinase
MTNTRPAPILLVDDDTSHRSTLSRYLAEHGWDVWEAATAHEGLELARKGAQVAIIDAHLPDMDSDAVCRQLKADPATRAIAVLRLSQAAPRLLDGVPMAEQVESTADAYLSQPVQPNELVATVTALLRMRDAEGRAEANQARLQASEAALRDAEAKLQRYSEELESKVAERTASLRQAINQMEEFSYTVSHDLRAPLRSIKGYAEVLLKDYSHRVKGEGARYLERIIENGQRMEQLVNDVLTFSRMANAKVKLGPQEINRLIETVIREYPTLQPAVATIDVERIPPVVGHESLCMQIFSNLLSNAVKFVHPGRRPEVRVSSETRGGVVRIYVDDNGIGISPEFHERIFGMFERLDPENRYGGTGIGLAIVRRAAEKMNGRVGVQSDGRNGSRFWVELPAVTPEYATA